MAGISDNQTARGGFWAELLRFSVYKRNQGRIARQATFVALALIIGIGVWRLAQLLAVWYGNSGAAGAGLGGAGDFGVLRFVVPAVLLALGIWFCYRIVNMPRFADFLIAVESEMAKVSWPSGDEVFRSSAVIIFLIFALSAILAGYDLFWWFVFRNLLKIG
jgi:preprotein translocase subunit SecE